MNPLTLMAVEVLLQAVDEVPAPEDVRPGWIALGSFLLLAFVTVLLWLSMRKQLRKIDFDEKDAAAEPEEHLENGDQRT